MGCHLSSNNVPLQRMDTENMLALPKNFKSSITRIRQEEVVDHLSSKPPSPCSCRGVFPYLSRSDSPLPSVLYNLFEDTNFPAESSSISGTKSFKWDDILWLRPYQISSSPKLFVNGVSRGDVKQGILGDCWLLSACAAVATQQHLLEQAVDPTQSLVGDGYQGLVKFRFWRFGEWVEVFIDDRLPTREGKLIFASCTHSDEFWLPLLEKAFAKVHGSYFALEGGHAGAALADLTGGIAERILVSDCSFQVLDTIFQHGAFVTCAGNDDSVQTTGLVHGHAYTITGVTKLRVNGRGSVNLLRLRSPWADNVEWSGAWSDRSSKWDAVSADDKVKCCVQKLDDGEFWMDFEDFRQKFQEITIATLGPDFDQDGSTDSYRKYELARGKWDVKSAGGSRNNLERFQKNPQYLLKVESPNNDKPNSFLIGLMQLPNNDNHKPLLPIAFFIYKTETSAERLCAEHFLCMQEEGSSGPFTDSWEVLLRSSFLPGDYIIVPATYQPDYYASFLLRIFSVSPFQLSALKSFEE